MLDKEVILAVETIVDECELHKDRDYYVLTYQDAQYHVRRCNSYGGGAGFGFRTGSLNYAIGLDENLPVAALKPVLLHELIELFLMHERRIPGQKAHAFARECEVAYAIKRGLPITQPYWGDSPPIVQPAKQ